MKGLYPQERKQLKELVRTDRKAVIPWVQKLSETREALDDKARAFNDMEREKNREISRLERRVAQLESEKQQAQQD